MNKTPRIGLIFSSITNGNLGVQALTYSALYLLDQACRFSPKIDSASFTVFDCLRASGDRKFEVHGNTIETETAIFRGVGKQLWFRGPVKAVLPEIKKCDIVFDLGLGDSFTDIYGNRRMISLLLSKYMLRCYSTPLVLAPQTIGPFGTKWSRTLANHTMRNAQRVYPRDALSANYLTEHRVPSASEVIPDMALFLPFKETQFDRGRVHIGLNVSGLLMNGGYTGDNQFGLVSDYPKLMRRLVAELLAMDDIQLHLVPHVLSDDPKEDDAKACKKLQVEFPGCVLAEAFKNPIQAKSYISGLDFFIGARMHSTIAAISAGVPVIPLAYSRKFNGLFGGTLGYPHIADLRAVNENEALKIIIEGFTNRHTIGQEVAEINDRLKQYREIMIASFASDIETAITM